ncbi:putative quinol monooxygenase [Nocardia sp. CNY236]|uniref:putative quinol monooxygenase n=1 Tax=Nocardia sp. CNY236 TaxID=1169152 RepID=UPI000428BAB1|nr:antibiotic biosynthesis monooxygenase [Nocardia sp. CNY236]
MFALVVKFDLFDEDAADSFDTLVADTVRQIAEHEPGTLVYSTHTVDDEPLSRIFYEVYADREAFGEHERQPHIRAFLDRRTEYVESFRVEFLGDGPAKGLPD